MLLIFRLLRVFLVRGSGFPTQRYGQAPPKDRFDKSRIGKTEVRSRPEKPAADDGEGEYISYKEVD